MSVLLLISVLSPAMTGLLLLAGGRTGRRWGVAVTAFAAVSAVVVAWSVAVRGPVDAVVTIGSGGSVMAGFYADRVSVVLLLLVLGVSAVVQGFATRYLRGDARADRFVAATGLLTTATAAMVTAATLIGMAVAWSAIGLGLWWLLRVYRADAWVPVAVTRTARMVLVGDIALWTGVIVATVQWGNVDLRALELPTTTSAPTGPLVAGALVVAAVARSALVPMAGWLPATVAAPTPLSALLHAGIVNGGGVLMLRLHPMIDSYAAVMGLAFVAGALTAVYGTALMLTRPDVKSALAYSTVGQMGFMVMTCALGAYSAALFHLVAHGMYKAALFLGSGSAVGDHLAERTAPPRPLGSAGARRAFGALALVVPAVALAGAVWLWGSVFGLAHSGTVLLLAFAWVTGTHLVWGWSRRVSRPGPACVFIAVLVAVMVAYLGALSVFSAFTGPALRAEGPAVLGAWTLIPVFAVIAVLTLARVTTVPALASLHKTLYVACLSLGDLGPRARRTSFPGGARRTAPARSFVPAVVGES
ncbi:MULTISPECIES: proton-conducting transporter membrane subunit [Nocardiaceae]|uniref:NADH-quinone oxidoreductase subunit L/NAD(P)H-quinone oxidoreductase subunit 5 n=1 Tax=Rhodococcus triatomae TaxID=300028 RepID=A0A1G8S986_9NOCA|nr:MULTISPECIES: proton-conducting transporter membrane subunit [Nocardiaceae]AVH20196.1 sodium:proton antiporter [Nocardia cyriacigeorgica]QNG19019.1 sodium:proton antiporter [Rhodococcus triatomae]QNG25068.1 sodium:proton antiporter [Rhodococcus triatomae]SDJ25786.1 NADH-quinone oxidoreductase subunit L/NAD(P)H-quinone oxidoreductase subunit 5 [Rhodococcus triatomae]